MKVSNLIAFSLITAGIMTLISCNRQQMPQGAKPVKNFDAEKYLGKWYEIARLDFSFEKNLNNTTAEYSLREDEKIKVVNRGYNYVKEKETEAVGKARFRDDKSTAALEVSFFGPFYSGYNVIALEGDYEYALVAGRNTDYLWILSRTTSVPDEVKLGFLNKAKQLGYNIEDLIWVEHNGRSAESK